MKKKIIVAVVLIGLFAVLYRYAADYLSLEGVKDLQAQFGEVYEKYPVLLPIAYLFVYVAVTALSLPGAAILTLAAGSLFGLTIGTLIVSFASSIGATCAFLVARYLVGETLQSKYGDKLHKVNEGVRKEGAFYLFAMRLVPAFPFFLVNILFALTTIRAIQFYWVSQLGMFAGTVVYVNAGSQLAQIESLSGLLSKEIILSFVVLGLLPIAAKKIIALTRGKIKPKESPVKEDKQ